MHHGRFELVKASILPDGSGKEVIISALTDTGSQNDAIPGVKFQGKLAETTTLTRGTNAITATGSPIISLETFKAEVCCHADDSNNERIETVIHVLQDLKKSGNFEENAEGIGDVASGLPARARR